MAAQSTGESQDATSWSCGVESKDRHPRESASATLAEKWGSSCSGKPKAREGDRSSKDGGCKGGCHMCVCWQDLGDAWEGSSHAQPARQQWPGG